VVQPVFYGWYIVAIGFLANTASAFSLSSTLAVFLKPLTEDLGVSRGVFSLLRSGESLIGAALSPATGSLVDRHGPRWLMTCGALVVGIGMILLSQVQAFWQFLLVRWSLSIGDAFMGSMVINVAIARWFIRKRGRALALSSMGIGFAKIGMPLFAASLLVWLGWRMTWAVFGVITLLLVVGPASIYMRRRPEDMGLDPDGLGNPFYETRPSGAKGGPSKPQRPTADEVVWTRKEAARTRTFWLIVITLGVSNIGVAGLNLHVFSYVNDTGHSALVAAAVMSIIAFMQLAAPLMWGLLAERIDLRKVLMTKFLCQAAGLSLAISTNQLVFLYLGFFIYGVGLGGGMVLPDLLWANYFGRVSLGTVRGLGLLLTHSFSAVGPPFFGFLFDLTQSYLLSFTLFIIALLISAFLSLLLRPPRK